MRPSWPARLSAVHTASAVGFLRLPMTGQDRADLFLRAILVMLAGILLLDLMALIIKHLSGAYGAAELSAYRNLFGMVPSLSVLWLSARWQAGGRRLRIRQWPLAWLRGGFTTLAQFLFYLSLARLEFATASTIAFSEALVITAVAVVATRAHSSLHFEACRRREGQFGRVRHGLCVFKRVQLHVSPHPRA